ncbi:MAG: exodeoxyribonuclease VII large subunit [Syntrophotaleaceae bacterium]
MSIKTPDVSGTEVLSVSRLVFLLRDVVEENFLEVVVCGEVANFATPSSGHYYFSLKDERAQLRAVMFRMQNRLLGFRPENGMCVICRGRLSVYSQRGEIQLLVDHLEPVGAGSLQVALEQLKKRLAAEGLFDTARKRPLPDFPRTIGIVTSPTGAAIHDILNVLRRRGAGLRILLRPVKVQGEGAAIEIAEGIGDLNRHGQADVLIVGRGGGSMEDLWAFNEEPVARAIFASAIPVISAVGHEVDVTIADLVADLRAPTPSAAAELVVKERRALESHLDHLVLRLSGQMRSRLQLLQERMKGLVYRLRAPIRDLELQGRRVEDLQRRASMAMRGRLDTAASRLRFCCGRLESLSPLRTLARGYAIVRPETGGLPVSDADRLKKGDRLAISFARGRALAVVEEVNRTGFPGKGLTDAGPDADNS